MHPSTGGGCWNVEATGARVITLDSSLGRVERSAVLAHELIHDERGVGWPDATAATMQTEEARVRAETARRLVPPAELAAFVRVRSEFDGVTARCVAEEFDVPDGVADLALRMLRTA